MALIPFDGELDGPEESGKLVPFDGELDDGESWLTKAAGIAETGLGMVAGMPAQIAGGLSGIGSLMIGEGVDKAVERMNKTQDTNFGAGAYKPSTSAGQRYTENVGDAMQSIQEGGGDVGAYLGGLVGKENAGRYIGELGTGFAMEMIDPGIIFGGAKALRNRKPKFTPRATPDVEIDVTVPGQPTEVFRSGEQMNLFDQFEERSPISPYQTEMAPDMWRVDENGIPIRADLSMEAQNLQQPLQRNLWGDEVDVNFPRDPNKPLDMETGDIRGVERFSEPVQFRNDPEGQIGLTQAIDNMPEGVQNRGADGRLQQGTTRQSALDRLRGELEASPELELAKKQAEAWIRENDTPLASKKVGRRQRGGVYFGENSLKKQAENLEAKMEKLKNSAFYKNLRFAQQMELLTPILNKHTEILNKLNDEADAARAARQAAELDSYKGFTKTLGDFSANERRAQMRSVPSVEVVPTETGFEARVNGNVVGKLDSNITPEQRQMLNEDASVDIVKVDPEFRGKGVGKALYDAWVKGMDGNVIPSGKTSKDAWAVWKRNYPEQVDKFVSQEQGRLLDGAPASQVLGNITDPEIRERVSSFNARTRGQGGGMFFGNNTKLENVMARSSDGTLIPDNPDVKLAVEQAKKGKDGKLWTYTQSGGISAAMKTGSPIIQAAARIVSNALKRSDLAVRNFVMPAERALKSLSKSELVALGNIMKAEMFSGVRKSADELMQTLSVKQLKAYTAMRDLFDKTLDSQNAARVAQGKDPISAKEAYLSSRWKGDFRMLVKDSEGRTVWALASHTVRDLNRQAAALKKLKPDLVFPKTRHVVKSTGADESLQSAYTTMLDILGRDDPAVKAIQAHIESLVQKEGSGTLAQEKHFEPKGNTRGFSGDRPWMDQTKDTVDMFQQQIQYAKNAFKWSEMQRVANDIKSIVSDPELQETQPNNVKFIREYYKNAIGLGEAEVSRAVNNALRNGLGVSPHLIDKAVGNMKSFFILQKLAASAGYTLSNLVQAGNVMPYLADLTNKGYVGNPATALAVGSLGGMMMGTAHYLKANGGSYIDKMPNDFLRDAVKYAEENSVTARSVYDEAPLEDSFSAVGRVATGLGKTMTVPETYVRSVAFMTYAQWLKDSGKFTDKMELFQKAEELVNMSMVDYRASERPMMFSKAGSAGNFLNTLQTYPFSFYNQWAYMLGQAAKGQPLGLAAIAAFQFAVAGAMGVPGFDDMDKFYKYLRDNFVSDKTWSKMMKNEFFADPKGWMINNLGQGAVYGALSDQTGLGMTSRVAAPGAGAMLQSPAGPVTDIAKQIGSVGSALMDPTNTTKVAQAAMDVAPVGFKGLLEQAPFMKDITYVEKEDGKKLFMTSSDLAGRRGGYERTPEEQAVRNWGIRSQKEVVSKDAAWALTQANQALDKKSNKLIDRIYDATRRGDTKEVKELATLYTDLTGKALSDSSFQTQIEQEFFSDIQKAGKKVSGEQAPQKLLNYARMKKILESK